MFVLYTLQENLSCCIISNHPQGGRIDLKRDARFFQNSRLYLDVPLAQQVKRAFDVMLLGNGAGLVPHDLSHDAGRHLAPLGKAAPGQQGFKRRVPLWQQRPVQTVTRHCFAGDRGSAKSCGRS